MNTKLKVLVTEHEAVVGRGSNRGALKQTPRLRLIV
jgi:hypothetical protein